MREFARDLKESMKPEVQAFWERAYRQKFLGVCCVEDCQQDREAQKAGIDRRIHLESGRVIAVDEKIRWESYPDFALEYKHVYSDGHISKGWVNKTLAIDYVAYGIIPEKRVYWLPYDLICDAWRIHRKEWIAKAQARQRGFFVSQSPNPGYVTFNCCVPRNVVLTAITDATLVDMDSADPYSDEEDKTPPFLESVLTIFGGEVINP